MSSKSPTGLPSPYRFAQLVLLLLLVALALAACGNGDPAATTSSSDEATTSTDSTTTTTDATTTSTEATTTSTTATGSTGTTSLPGEPIDFFFKDGDILGVIGVAHDDLLNVRARPGADAGIVARLDPLADDVKALGRSRRLSQSIWTEVAAEGARGWVNVSFVAFLGSVDDITSQVIQRLGERPKANTIEALGRIVAEAMASDEPPSDIVMSVPPISGDLGEVTFDVVGLGDDAQRGWRLHVFGQPSEDGSGFTLKSVEATILCGRGVTDEGVCQ